MSRVLNLILTHLSPGQVDRILEWWKPVSAPENILVVHGGVRSDFEGVRWGQKIFVDDPLLRVRDMQREKQSLGGVVRGVEEWLRGRDFTHIYWSEFDHLPLVTDLSDRQLGFMDAEGADVLGHYLNRIDGTNSPHYLYHAADPAFHEFWRKVSVRSHKNAVLTMFGSGTFWKREALEAVARVPETVRCYGEIYLPTLAHHLGYRVRDFTGQNDYILAREESHIRPDLAREAGMWTVHPIKTTPDAVAWWNSCDLLLGKAKGI